MTLRIVKYLVFTIAMLGWIADASAQLLDEVEVTESNTSATISLQFASPVRYQRHLPRFQGTELVIHYQAISGRGETQRSRGRTLSQKIRIGNLQTKLIVSEENVRLNDYRVSIRFGGLVKYMVRPDVTSTRIDIIVSQPLATPSGQTRAVRPPAPVVPASKKQRAPVSNKQTKDDRRSISSKQAEKMLAQGKQALREKKYDHAAAIFSEIMLSGESRYEQEAHELLGLCFERKGNKAQARVEFKLYLKKYPSGEASDRVQQRLAVLEGGSSKKLKKGKSVAEQQDWELFGTWAQTYYYGKRKTDTLTDTGTTVFQEPTLTDTDQSSLISNIDMIARQKSANSSQRFVISGDYDYDFINHQDKGRLRNAYYQYKNTEYDYSIKAGRQSAAVGALSRFDGVLLGKELNPKFRLNFVAGVPFDDIAKNSDRVFNGINLDMGTFNGRWAGGLYYFSQEIDGLTDREAVGTELRYFRDSTFVYNLVDYDVYFDELNIFLLQGGWQTDNGATYNVLFDYRRSPSLQLSNMLIGETTTSIESLKSVYTEEQMKALALDRATTSQIISASVLYPLSKKWQLGGDLSVTSIDPLPASGTLPATPGTGDIYTYGIKAIASKLFLDNDTALVGLTRTDADTLTETTLYATERFYAFNNKWLFNFDLKFYQRDNTIGSTVNRFVPATRIEYRKKNITFEFEYGQENTESRTAIQTENTTRDYYAVGYRWDF